MADKPIRVSSTAWTGLSAEAPLPPPSPNPKPPPSPTQVIAGSLFMIAIGAYGAWKAFVTGRASCRGCDTFTAADDPAQYGFIIFVLILCVPVGIGMLFVGIGDARRKARAPDLLEADEPHESTLPASGATQVDPVNTET